MPEVADFLARFPAFEGAPEPQLVAALEDAGSYFDRASFSNETIFNRAIMLWAAHNLTLAGVGTSVEANITSQGFSLDSVQSVSDSGVSVSLKQGAGTSPYDSTGYGRELAKLLKIGLTRRMAVGGPDNRRRYEELMAALRLSTSEW